MINWAFGMFWDSVKELMVGTMMSWWPFTTKGRLFDGLEFRKTFATRLTPLGDSHPLCCHCLRRCGRVHVILSHMPSRPEGPCGGLARSGGAEEQIKKRLDRD